MEELVQATADGEVNGITETKGRVWEGTTAKDDAMHQWCERISQATGAAWRYKRVNQPDFDVQKSVDFAGLISALNSST